MNFQAIATKIIEYAGFSDRVKIIVGKSDEIIPLLNKKYGVQLGAVDLVFIDHWKDRYLPDLHLLEGSGLMKNGTVIVADNILYPGAPAYVEYIRNSTLYRTKFYKMKLEYSDIDDGVEVSTYLGNK